MVHSAAKLKRMCKEVSSSFSSVEAKSNVSGRGSNDFWDFCSERADHSTKEGQLTKPTLNRKRQKTSHLSEILERVNALLENETTDISAAQEDTWNEQRIFIQEQRTAQKLTTLYSRLDRNDVVTKKLLVQRQEFIAQGLGAAESGEALAVQQQKKQTLKLHISELECELMHGVH
ncbi:hypothetical protein PHMEG_0006249 [Phytophthora megakarya]|uniref:Uncharacterized protein n=1 Tax=Phytophthora megakarya TaxID=4795 RepID=A0A225WPN3_9STRA|nr:hypothetical protein PHMEG_0006249 [Phytophthora megakarya]